MPEISLTEAQYEQLEAIRADVEDAFVDTYGHARLEDAVDYLLDTYTPPDERDAVVVAEGFERIATAGYPALQRIAADVPDIPGSGIDADEMRGKLLAELGPVDLAERLAGGGGDDVSDSEAGAAVGANDDGAVDTDDAEDATVAEDADTDTDADESVESAAEEAVDADGTPEGDDTDEQGDSTSQSSGETVDPLAGPGNALSAVNKLLREHDDKWRKTETGEEPYEVDLPDGTTKGVRTKDDVRQYLFKHY